MSFDSSIELKIKNFNSKHKINNIIHIGACLGEEAGFYSTLDPKLIYWFEPNPKLIPGLINNVNNYPYINNVYEVAVSNTNGKSYFNIIEDDNNSNPGCSSLCDLKIHSELYPHLKKKQVIEVETIVLDEFLNKNNLETKFDMVSLDTQGNDYQILTSSKYIFNSKIIVIETAKVELYENQKVQDEIDNILDINGFRKEYYHEFHELWGDTLYIKKTL